MHLGNLAVVPRIRAKIAGWEETAIPFVAILLVLM